MQREPPENPRAVTQRPSINQASPQGGKCPLRAVAPAAEASEQCADMQELRVHWILAVGPGLKQQILYKQIMYKEPRKKDEDALKLKSRSRKSLPVPLEAAAKSEEAASCSD